MATPAARSLAKALDLLGCALADDGGSTLAELAARVKLPASTAHRLAATLRNAGYLTRERPGHYLPGPVLLGLLGRIEESKLVARLARPILRRLAQQTRQTAHLGVMQADMVTYLVKEAAGAGAVFTREGIQLEAYCSGVGKVLLAHLPAAELDRYLSEGPFVALTSRTITDPRALRAHLEAVRAQGFAAEIGEVADGLACLAAPVAGRDGVRAAISVACPLADFTPAYRASTLASVRAAAAAIATRAYQTPG